MATRGSKRQARPRPRATGDAAREATGGQARDWECEPAIMELFDGRYRVDFDWLQARLTEIAHAFGVPRTGYSLAPHLMRVRRRLAQEAVERARAEGREAPDPEPGADDKRSAAGVINAIAFRASQPSEQTLDELAALAREAGIREGNLSEWLRRGGRLPWATPAMVPAGGDAYDARSRIIGEMLRRKRGADRDDDEALFDVGFRAFDGATDAYLEAMRKKERERTQPRRRNGTNGAAGPL